jgi:hypothetical protein
MTLTPEDRKITRKLIDIPSWVKKQLLLESVNLGYDGLKAYIESLLKEKAKELKAR